jgi:hypothetical protein
VKDEQAQCSAVNRSRNNEVDTMRRSIRPQHARIVVDDRDAPRILDRFRVFKGVKAFLRTDDQFPFCMPIDFCGVAASLDEWNRKLTQERTDIFELVVVE